MPGLVRLPQVPQARLTIACGPCGRRWSVTRLAERHGAEIALPELLRLLTANRKW